MEIITLTLINGVYRQVETVPVLTSSVSWIDIVSLLVIPILLPAAVGFFTKVTVIPAFWKRLILALLAGATAGLTQLVDAAVGGTPFDIGWFALQWVIAYVAAEFTYQRFYKAPLVSPADVANPAVETKTIASILANSGVK